MKKRKPPPLQILSEPPQTRPGPRDAKGVIADRILAAARSLFASNGYGSTSLRSVAESAGVDVALVSYYFKNKAGLLDAVLTVPADYLAGVAAKIAETPLEERARAMVAQHLSMWENETTSEILRSAILAAANEPLAMERVRLLYGRTLDIVSHGLPDEERTLRAGLVASQFVGMAMMRYVWRIGPLATISRADVVAFLTPVIERYLNEPLRE
jgi:AcrR family transcriptional regulator